MSQEPDLHGEEHAGHAGVEHALLCVIIQSDHHRICDAHSLDVLYPGAQHVVRSCMIESDQIRSYWIKSDQIHIRYPGAQHVVQPLQSRILLLTKLGKEHAMDSRGLEVFVQILNMLCSRA